MTIFQLDLSDLEYCVLCIQLRRNYLNCFQEKTEKYVYWANPSDWRLKGVYVRDVFDKRCERRKFMEGYFSMNRIYVTFDTEFVLHTSFKLWMEFREIKTFALQIAKFSLQSLTEIHIFKEVFFQFILYSTTYRSISNICFPYQGARWRYFDTPLNTSIKW